MLNESILPTPNWTNPNRSKPTTVLKLLFYRLVVEMIYNYSNFQENNMNIIHMLESFQFRNHICMTFELLSINLYELIKKNKFQGFSLQVSLMVFLQALRNELKETILNPAYLH